MDILCKNIPEAHIATFVTFRTYGSWLYGDGRGSIDRYTNTYGQQRLPPNARRYDAARKSLRRASVTLDRDQRRATRSAIRETCSIRDWTLFAENVRTNHVHVVVAATVPSRRIAAVLKANATRAMRNARCWTSDESPWSRGASAKRVWTELELEAVVRYVLEGQGEVLDSRE